MKTINLHIRNFPADLNQLLKVKAAMRGVTLQSLVVELLTAAAKQEK